MGLTNFHTAAQLLERSGRKQELQAIIQEFKCPVYVNYTSFTKEAVEQYSWRLRYGHLDQWVMPSDGTPEVTLTKTPDPLKVPKLCIAPIFPPNVRSSTEDDAFSNVDYIFLVEGNRGANQKLVVVHDIHDAGVLIFHEAMNGFSIVFSGAVPKAAFKALLTEPKNRYREISFKKVESIEACVGAAAYFQESMIGPRYLMPTYEIPIFC